MRIIYIDLDSMRPRHFGCYGYHRNTTPNMDQIAREGVRFTHAYCSSSPCMPARAGFMTGRLGIHNGVVNHRGAGSELRFPGEGHYYRPDMPMFPRYLRQNGYKTASFSSFSDRHQAHWFTSGWSEMHVHTLKGGLETAEEVNAEVIPWLETNGSKDNYFLHIQYWDAHRPYRMPAKWAEAFKDEPLPNWPDQKAIDDHQKNYGVFSAAELHHEAKSPVSSMPDQINDLRDFRKMVDGYDGSIRYMDHYIGKVFDTLKRLGVYEDTAIIISGDHGESMGEQGIYGDHVSASEAVHNISMIVRWPGVTPANVEYDGFLYNIDLMPSICELLGFDVPPRWDGQSFAPALRGESWEGRPYLVWDHGLYCCQRVVRTKEWAFTRTYHPGIFPWEDTFLNDIVDDPYQQVNLANEYPDVVKELDHLMMTWLHENLGRHGTAQDPLQAVVQQGPWCYVHPIRWINRLEEKGRVDAVEEILARLDVERDFKTPSGLKRRYW